MKNRILKYHNQWESDSYTVNGKRVADLMEVSIAGTRYDVHSKRVRVPYDDMGREYHGESMHYFIGVKVGTQVIEIDLNRIVRHQTVYVLKYETEEDKT